MTRRRFAFWLGIALFWLAEKVNAAVIDDLAATLMHGTEPRPEPNQLRWKAGENRTWRWFERQTYVDRKWKTTGITTPVNKETGDYYTGRSGYLDESVVPAELRRVNDSTVSQLPADHVHLSDGKPDPDRRAREGRPPSKWLRSLKADEIKIWLKTIEVPPVGVSGMTFETHLTRDHSFDPGNIVGLTIAEQAKLHSAAHYGY